MANSGSARAASLLHSAYVLILSTAVRVDHVPVAEAVMSILLTYYVDATLYLGTPVEATVGVASTPAVHSWRTGCCVSIFVKHAPCFEL